MHPDAIIAALRMELEELEQTPPEDLDDRKAQIAAEIKRIDGLPRPEVKAEEGETVFDRGRAYLDALKVELSEAVAERRDEIKAEIKRVEAHLRSAESKEAGVEDAPSAEEIKQRKQARTGRRAERATAAPGEVRGNEADEAVTAPEGAKEQA